VYDFISGQTIHNYLVSFAEDHDLVRPIRLWTRVTQVRKNANHQGWIVETQSGERLIECNKLIYAMEANSSPIRPEMATREFQQARHPLPRHCHQSVPDQERRNLASHCGGSLKPSYDNVYELLKAEKKIDWIIRPSASGAFPIFVPTFMGWWRTPYNHGFSWYYTLIRAALRRD
jgi:hypothetical protein